MTGYQSAVAGVGAPVRTLEVRQLAHSKSALKRWRQNEAHRERNKSVRTGARSALKKAHTAIAAGPPDEAQAAIREAAGVVDRASKHNVLHRNAASRHKSRLMRHLNKTAGAAPVEEAPKKARKTAAKPATKTAAKPKAKAPVKPRATKAKPASKT
jgi:small subunit ribosomal protein S20